MISAFLREQKRYTLEELSSIMSCSEETSVSILRILKEYGILKAVKANDRQKDMSDLFDEDIAVADVDPGRSDLYYVLTFVGVIAVAGRVLKCYPKYLLTNESPVRELGQILKVLERYNSKEQIIKLFNDSDNSRSFNLLAVLLFLLTDYYENGSYSNTEDVIESNGPGVILWDKTINETFALLNNNRPFYIDLQTKRRVFNDYDYFKRLHECVLTRASKELYEANLLDLFEITEVNLSDELLEDFGDKDYILYRIEKELSIQFNTRKQLVLKTLYAYIDQNSSLQDIDCLSLFGTNSFNLVWESVCAEILNNQLNTCLGDLSLPVPLRPQYSKSIKLMDLIEKPFWSAAERYAMSTLIPDIVTIVQNKGEYKFAIFDAKYYSAQLHTGSLPKGQPGIESITKQYMYQVVFHDFIKDHSIQDIQNCFVFPTEEATIVDKGFVRLDCMRVLGLEDIQVRLFPASLAFNLYLSAKKYDQIGLLL